MKLIESSVQIIEEKDPYKMVELAGRTCYHSQDKITENSAKEFVDRMIKLGHGAMLEHGTVYLRIRETVNGDMPPAMLYWRHLANRTYSRINYKIEADRPYKGNYGVLYITTNMRVLVENERLDDLQYQCEPTEYHDKRITAKFICDRSVSHEFVRHRVFSFAQESTRYVGSSSVKPIDEFDCDDNSDICTAYQQGFSMKNIANNSSLTEWGVRKILLENNVEIRGLNNRGNRVEDYFSVIDTPEKAYLLGMIQTDGSLRKDDRSTTLSITQHKDYYWYIEDMLLNFSDYVYKSKDKNCIQLQIGSKAIVNDLINLGIVPNKTKVQTDEDIITLWNSIPEEFKGDFIRGCIDGDGHVTFFTQKKAINESCNIGFYSVKEILVDKIIELINTKFNYKCGKTKDKNLYKLSITDRKKAIEIGKYLYTNFKYPFGHPKKASAWISRINECYPIADYKDCKFQIIEPQWLRSSSPMPIYTFVRAMDTCEDCYTRLRLSGLKPQEARAILPNATKTELVMTGFESDWEGFFKLRCSGAAHPDAQKLANKLKELLTNVKNN